MDWFNGRNQELFITFKYSISLPRPVYPAQGQDDHLFVTWPKQSLNQAVDMSSKKQLLQLSIVFIGPFPSSSRHSKCICFANLTWASCFCWRFPPGFDACWYGGGRVYHQRELNMFLPSLERVGYLDLRVLCESQQTQ